MARTLHLIVRKKLNIDINIIAETIEKLEEMPPNSLEPRFFDHTVEEPFARQQKVQETIRKGEVVLIDAETYFSGSEANGIPGKFYVAFPGDTLHLYEVGPKNPFRRVWPPLDPVQR